jgi:hypothetical protein
MSDAYRPLPEDLDGWHDRVVEMATYEKYADELKKFALTAKIFVRDKWRLEGTPSGLPQLFCLPLDESDRFRISGELGEDGLPLTARLEFHDEWRGLWWGAGTDEEILLSFLAKVRQIRSTA